MTSRGVRARRMTAEDRRTAMVAAATRLALAEGLDQLTVRGVAQELGVAGSLVSHYFPSVDDLVAEAFAAAATHELDQIFAEVDRAGSPREGVRRLLDLVLADDREAISLLWIDAWHAARRRPALSVEASRQMSAWTDRLAGLLEAGRDAGEFRTADPVRSATHVLAVVDGLSVQAVMGRAGDVTSVRELVVTVAELELGLSSGALHEGLR